MFFIIVFLLTSCCMHAIYGTQETEIKQVKVEEKITLDLPSTPSTGYSWKIKTIDPTYLKVVGEQFISSSSQMPGAPGMQQFVLQAQCPGTTETIFIYERPFEKKEPVKERRILFHIMEK